MMPEFTISLVTVKRVGTDLRLPSSQASPAAGDVSPDCRPSRRQNIQLQLAVRRIRVSNRPRRSASLAFGLLPGGLPLKRASTNWRWRRNCPHAEGDSTRGRQWNKALSDHTRGEQAVAADLRQADDLLPAVDFDVGRYSRHSHYHDANGSLPVRTAARRWQPVGHSSHLCRAAQTSWACRSLHHRSRFYRTRARGHG